MKKLGISLLLLVFVIMTGCTQEEIVEETADLEQVVEDFSVYFDNLNGSFILYCPEEESCTIYNENIVDTYLTPVSTFKIYNTLIGLESNVLTGKDHVKTWDQTSYDLQSWNRDHTLESALDYSVDWYFQDIAEEIGKDVMSKYIADIGYGNKDISGGLMDFWLESSLQITPRQQVELLRKLYEEQLPFSPEHVTTLKELLVLETEEGYELSGETGTAVDKVGWFVGSILKDEKRYYFATTLVDNNKVSGARAKEITIDILKDMALY